MIWKQYNYAALAGACIAFGVIAAGRIGDHSLGAAHVVVACVLTAILTVKTTKVADSKR